MATPTSNSVWVHRERQGCLRVVTVVVSPQLVTLSCLHQLNKLPTHLSRYIECVRLVQSGLPTPLLPTFIIFLFENVVLLFSQWSAQICFCTHSMALNSLSDVAIIFQFRTSKWMYLILLLLMVLICNKISRIVYNLTICESDSYRAHMQTLVSLYQCVSSLFTAIITD